MMACTINMFSGPSVVSKYGHHLKYRIRVGCSFAVSLYYIVSVRSFRRPVRAPGAVVFVRTMSPQLTYIILTLLIA